MSDVVVKGTWHKVKMRCERCGNVNRHGLTYVVNSPEITGKFDTDRCAHAAWDEMKQGKKEGII